MATIGPWPQHLTHFEEITEWRPISLFSEIEKTTETLLNPELLLPTDYNGIAAEFETRLTDTIKTSCVMTPGGLRAGTVEYHHYKTGSNWVAFGQLGLPEQSIRSGAVWQFAPTRRLLVETDGPQRAIVMNLKYQTDQSKWFWTSFLSTFGHEFNYRLLPGAGNGACNGILANQVYYSTLTKSFLWSMAFRVNDTLTITAQPLARTASVLVTLCPSLAARVAYTPSLGSPRDMINGKINVSLGYLYKVADHTTIRMVASQQSFNLLFHTRLWEDCNRSSWLENWSLCAGLSILNNNSPVIDVFDRVKVGIKLRYSS